MTENEAKIFIQNAMEQSRNVLAELMLIMPKVFAAKRKSLGEYYSNLENCKKEIQSCEVAVKALEEVQKYRAIGTPEEFLKMMTDRGFSKENLAQINCNLMLLKEYTAIGTPEELQDMKNDYAEALSDWRQYRKIGTLEECRAAMEKQTAKRPRIIGNAMICPSCPRCFKSASPTYCPSCGQMIDWGNEE